MDDDFNTGGAVGDLFELVRTLNKFADDQKLEDRQARRRATGRAAAAAPRRCASWAARWACSARRRASPPAATTSWSAS